MNKTVQGWFKDPEFSSLLGSDKERIIGRYFDDEMADDDFKSLPENERNAIRSTFIDSNLEPHRPKPISRGVFGDIGASVSRGALGAGEMVLRGGAGAAELFGIAPGAGERNMAREIGQDIAAYREEAIPVSREALTDPVRKAWTGGVESATTSLLAVAPAVTLGALTGGAGAAAAGYLMGAPMFGAAQYDQSLEDFTKKGVPKDQAHMAALMMGASEAGFEFVTDALEIATVGFGGLVTKPLKDAGKQAVKRTIASTWGEAAKRVLAVAATETIGESANVGTQAEIEKGLGTGNERFWGAVKDQFGQVAVAGLIFGAIGGGLHKARSSHVKGLITDKDADPEERLGAVREVYDEIKRTDPSLAERWRTGATMAVLQGRAISEDIEEGSGFGVQGSGEEAPGAPVGSAGEDTTVTAAAPPPTKADRSGVESITGRRSAPVRQASVVPEEEAVPSRAVESITGRTAPVRRPSPEPTPLEAQGEAIVAEGIPEGAAPEAVEEPPPRTSAAATLTGRSAPVRQASVDVEGESVADNDARSARPSPNVVQPDRIIEDQRTAEIAREEISKEQAREEVSERAAEAAGDILNKDGKPYANANAARFARRGKKLEGSHDVVAVTGGFALRPRAGQSPIDKAAQESKPAAAATDDLEGIGKSGKKIWKEWVRSQGTKPGDSDHAEAFSWFKEIYHAGRLGKIEPRKTGGLPLAYDERQAYTAGRDDAKPQTTAAQTITGRSAGQQSATKEPWEMTRRQYIDNVSEGLAVDDRAYQRHKNIVATALNEGKSVPDEVLAEYPDLVEKPQTSAAATITGKPGAPAEAKDMADWAGKMMSRGAARIGGVDYSVQQAGTGSFYYRRTQDGVRTEKGPGPPAKWSRKEAVIQAAKEAKQDFERWQREQEKAEPVEGAAADQAVEAGPAAESKGLKVEYIGPLNWTVVDADGNWLARFETEDDAKQYIGVVEGPPAAEKARSARTSPSEAVAGRLEVVAERPKTAAAETITGARPSKSVAEASVEDILGEIDRQVAERAAPKERMAESAEKIKAGMARIADLARQANAVFDEKGQLSEGEFDEGRWNKLKPIFSAMWEEAQALKMNVKEFVAAVLDQLGTQAAGYFKRWAREEFASPKQLAQEKTVESEPEGKTIPQEKAAEAEPQAAKRLDEITVEIKAYSESGAAMMVREKADVALAENSRQLEMSRKILECLNI